MSSRRWSTPGRRHGLPLHLLDRYMESMRVDCDEPVRLPDRAALDSYMEGSAATVGRIMAAALLGALSPRTWRAWASPSS